MFQTDFYTIIADRVRYTAIGFWQKMGFEDKGDGNYIWPSHKHRETSKVMFNAIKNPP